MKRVSIAKTPSSVCGLISPPELVTMKVRPWLIVMPGGATLISIGIGSSLFLLPRSILGLLGLVHQESTKCFFAHKGRLYMSVMAVKSMNLYFSVVDSSLVQ